MEEQRYEVLHELGSGYCAETKLAKNIITGELVAIKFIKRSKIDESIEREIVNQRSLSHENVIKFKEVFVTETHLAIVLEYAAGGELFSMISTVGRFVEDEARYFFQQLISGVHYIHSMKICHRDLKLENILLDGSPIPRLKICDFGLSKSELLHSRPISMVGTPAYIAPEVFSMKEYDGKMADVWSCGVTLYIMLVGTYPFEDPQDSNNFKNIVWKIKNVQYSIPDNVRISPECRQLLSSIFVANPAKRITISEIEHHPWFKKKMYKKIVEADRKSCKEKQKDQLPSQQSVEEIMRIVQEAKTSPRQDSSDAADDEEVDVNDDDEEDYVDVCDQTSTS